MNILRSYETVSDEFFKWLDHNSDGKLLFAEMLTTRILKSARETGTPMDGAAPWLRGQISICDEFLNRMSLTFDQQKPEANGGAGDGFSGGLGGGL